MPGLAGKGDVLAVDRLAHNSILEAAKIAHDNGADLRIFEPCTGAVLQGVLPEKPEGGCVVAVDGVYSMQGTTPPLKELDQVARARGGITSGGATNRDAAAGEAEPIRAHPR